MSELALYNIERELEEVAAHEQLTVEIVPLLGNAHHRHRVREVLAAFGVQTVYHAAAYKHVPIVEHNVVEGIHNNVISTWYTAEAALETGVETFVLISTDKAVNPANVMGATKRLAELVLQALQERTTHTRFCMVRFGNVLASSGSVVPLFQEQIRRGGPVTVTHPDVIRYFMTIPEAAQLVIQAGSMAKGGDVFVLDMGRPVRIDDLARRMINLMGLTVRDASNPDGDIEIEYTGLRTGGEAVRGAADRHQRHRHRSSDDHACHGASACRGRRCSRSSNELLVALASFDCHRALALLAEAVAEYQADVDIRDYVWTRKAVAAARPGGQGRRLRRQAAPAGSRQAHARDRPRAPKPLTRCLISASARLSRGAPLPLGFRLSSFRAQELNSCASPSSAPATWASSPAPALRTPATTWSASTSMRTRSSA